MFSVLWIRKTRIINYFSTYVQSNPDFNEMICEYVKKSVAIKRTLGTDNRDERVSNDVILRTLLRSILVYYTLMHDVSYLPTTKYVRFTHIPQRFTIRLYSTPGINWHVLESWVSWESWGMILFLTDQNKQIINRYMVKI